MNVRIEPTWKKLLSEEWDKPYFADLVAFVKNEYATKTIYPPASKIFSAFDSCSVDNVKVVIIGQDPYHGPRQANGLCFSVDENTEMPPSLVNIFKEIHDDTGAPFPANGDLSRWAKQGVLLLNSTLTVAAHQPTSHQGHGWEEFTDKVIELLASTRENIVFMLWGSYAIKKGKFIDRKRHMVLTSAHPSPLSAYRGFFGNHHFSQANSYLVQHGREPINW